MTQYAHILVTPTGYGLNSIVFFLLLTVPDMRETVDQHVLKGWWHITAKKCGMKF